MTTLYKKYTLPSNADIRLLHLLPAKSSKEPLVCKLSVTSLDAKLFQAHFDALSYVWGNSTERLSISCDGNDIPVTDNLAHALRQLRQQTQTRVIWVDALCINQMDIPERNRQVLLMCRIYREAREVIIWLGRADEETEIAFDVIREICRLVTPRPKSRMAIYNKENDSTDPSLNITAKIFDANSADGDTEWQPGHNVLPSEENAAWVCLSNLFDRPWFHRAWIIQEAVVSKINTFHCGPFELKWEDMTTATKSLEKIPLGIGLTKQKISAFTTIDFVRSAYQSLFRDGYTQEERQEFASHLCIEPLLRLLGSCQATDPRDKVFSIISLASDLTPLDLRPDYASSVRGVYTSIARVLIEKQRSINVLGLSGRRNSDNDTELPSWVPDWRRLYDNSSWLFHRYSATTEIPFLLPKQDNSEQLPVGGFVIDTVKSVVRDMREIFASELQEFFDEEIKHQDGIGGIIQRIEKNLLPLPVQDILRPDSESALQALGRTLMLDLAQDGCRLTATELSLRGPDIYRWLVETSYITIGMIVADGSSIYLHQGLSKDDAYTRHLEDILTDRSIVLGHLSKCDFLVTRKNRIGMCPRETRCGDIICLLPGSNMPIILRADGDEWYNIGACYLHGIMDGEEMVQIELQGLQATKFVLK